MCRARGRCVVDWMKPIGIVLAFLGGAYFVVRAIVELVTIDYDDPSSYEDDWGGPPSSVCSPCTAYPASSCLVLMIWGARRLRRLTCRRTTEGTSVRPGVWRYRMPTPVGFCTEPNIGTSGSPLCEVRAVTPSQVKGAPRRQRAQGCRKAEGGSAFINGCTTSWLRGGCSLLRRGSRLPSQGTARLQRVGDPLAATRRRMGLDTRRARSASSD